ncbi:PspC domain-containing protein [Aureitalea marina]|uniref:Uncharacterized protein n=1 Tax=Aureitalea marina TaxID=930804 RepID=A0A2S7KPX3_9FLAO|nr:PspC domain-containing protein [Aureitalea marina]PQB04660.1 hypothetical protein BST85_06945 [Aureitalea marina]
MNKTININLAGTFFHVDENAYGKLSRYLDAIRKSLSSDAQTGDEIMRDIEARIAELFSEKLESSTQVVTVKELDEVIAVMGQPEDYMVDEEIFDDQPQKTKSSSSTSGKKLYRDLDDKFIGGVSAGLAHYFGVDALWIRLTWVALVLLGFGTPILIYILLWILIPGAETTAEKLRMTGEPVNISNIEKKFKEGYENVADQVKNADYDKYGQKVKKGASGFFDTLGNILLVIFKIFVKFLGILLIIISLSTLVGLIVGLFTVGTVDFWGAGEFTDYISLVDTSNAPIWLVSLMVLFAVGIPFFVLFILGLKLLIDNLKSIGTPAKISLLVVWIASIIGLGILGLRQASETAFEGDVKTSQTLPVKAGDTLNMAMSFNTQYEYSSRRSGGLEIMYDEDDNKVIYSNDIRLIVRSTNDSVGKVTVERRAEGRNFQAARDRARAIDHNYSYSDGQLTIDGYFTTDFANKYRDQEMEIVVYLPVGTILYADQNTYTFHRNDSYYRDILNNGDEEQYLLIEDGSTSCLDCPEGEDQEWRNVDEDDRYYDDDDGIIYFKNDEGDWIKVEKRPGRLEIRASDGDQIIVGKDREERRSRSERQQESERTIKADTIVLDSINNN